MAEAGPDKSFVQKVLLTVCVVCLTALVIAVVFFTLDVLLLIFAAILLAIFLHGLANVLNRYLNIGEGGSVVLVSVLLVGVLAGAIALLAPDVAEQVAHLRVALPQSAAAATAYLSQFGWSRAVIDQLPSMNAVLEGVNTSTLLAGVGGFFSSTVGAVGNFFIVILLGIYLASEPRLYCRGITNLFPVARRTRAREVLFAMGDTLQWWLVGKVGSMLFIGLLTWIGLSIIGVPLALALGLIAGLLSFIPNFGPIISAVPAVLLAFIDSPVTAVYVLALYIGVQLIESNLVTPLIERQTVELPPALTIVFQLGLAVLVGGLGLVLATPLLAAIIVVVQLVYVEDVLGDRSSEKRDTNSKSKRKPEESEIDGNGETAAG